MKINEKELALALDVVSELNSQCLKALARDDIRGAEFYLEFIVEILGSAIAKKKHQKEPIKVVNQ